jgi:hypothetical protein
VGAQVSSAAVLQAYDLRVESADLANVRANAPAAGPLATRPVRPPAQDRFDHPP